MPRFLVTWRQSASTLLQINEESPQSLGESPHSFKTARQTRKETPQLFDSSQHATEASLLLFGTMQNFRLRMQ